MAIRPLPKPHIPVVRQEQSTEVWREYWESIDRFLKSIAVETLTFEFHGISANTKRWIKVPFDCEIIRWTATADKAGSVEVSLWRSTYDSFPPTSGNSIVGAAPITITSSVKNTNSTLTGWTKVIPSGSYLMANINSVTNIQDLLIEIEVSRL